MQTKGAMPSARLPCCRVWWKLSRAVDSMILTGTRLQLTPGNQRVCQIIPAITFWLYLLESLFCPLSFNETQSISLSRIESFGSLCFKAEWQDACLINWNKLLNVILPSSVYDLGLDLDLSLHSQKGSENTV